MMSHGASAEADSIRRTAQVCPRAISMRSGLSLALSHQRVTVKTPGLPAPVKAVSRQSRARKARALTGVGWSGIASICADVSATHCADLLSAKENPDSCNVRRCQKSCYKSLRCHTTDRGAPCAFYPALKRSVVCASPVLCYPSPNCDRRKVKPTAPVVNSEQIRCGRGAELHDRSRFARWRPGRWNCRG